MEAQIKWVNRNKLSGRFAAAFASAFCRSGCGGSVAEADGGAEAHVLGSLQQPALWCPSGRFVCSYHNGKICQAERICKLRKSL